MHVQQKHDAHGTIQWRRPVAQALEKARSFCIDIILLVSKGTMCVSEYVCYGSPGLAGNLSLLKLFFAQEAEANGGPSFLRVRLFWRPPNFTSLSEFLDLPFGIALVNTKLRLLANPLDRT